MPLPKHLNNGRVMYDVAITGITDAGTQEPVPFLLGNSDDYPYLRESDGGVREQIDTTMESGEQSLSDWWYRSQGSFHLGRGLNYFDTASDDSVARRFSDSCGVHVFDAGSVRLLNSSYRVRTHAKKSYIVSYTQVEDTGQVSEGGVILAESNFDFGYENATRLYKITEAGAVTELDVSATGNQPIFDLTTDGNTIFLLADTMILRKKIGGSGNGTPMYRIREAKTTDPILSNVNGGRIAALKDRLILAVSHEYEDGTTHGKVYNLVPTYKPTAGNTTTGDDLTTNELVGTVQIDGWRWTGICDGPNAIYFGGYAGGLGRIYAVSLNADSNPPTLGGLTVVAELPRGEIVTRVISYMGVYLVIGTNKGVRVATINDGGSLTVGPLSVKTDAPIWGMCAVGDYVYFGGSFTFPWEDIARPGLYKLNLGVDGTDPRSQLGIFPVARDLYAPDVTVPGVNQVLRVCPIGNTQRVAFTCDNTGTYFQHPTNLVPNGYLSTGKIRFDTQELKNFSYLRVTKDAGVDVLPYVEQDGGGAVALGSPEYASATRKDYVATTDELPHLDVRYIFKISGSGSFNGYQVRGRPSNVVSRNIRLPLLCFPREKIRQGLNVKRPTWDRIKMLERAEKRGAPVLYQNLNTGEEELATIEKIQFIETHVQGCPSDAKNPGGYLLVTLRLVNK